MRSLDLTSKIRKDRSPASTPSPIPPSGSVCANCSVAVSEVRCLEAPEITSLSPPLPSSAEEHAEVSSKAVTSTASIRVFFMGASDSLPGNPRRARLYDGQSRSGPHTLLAWRYQSQRTSRGYLRLALNVAMYVVSEEGAMILWVRARPSDQWWK